MNGENQKPADTPPDSQWKYTSDQAADEQPVLSPDYQPPAVRGAGPQEVSWTASEFVAHSKNGSWFALLALAALAIAVIVWFITHDKISVGVVIVVAILLGVTAGRKPRVLEYHLDTRGLTVEEKFYPYSDFRSFAVMQEGAFSSIMFVPLKRFALPISIYYDPEDEEAIATVISQHLPIEERQHDTIDKITRGIRF
jgi:hypothetical protein